MSKDRRKALLGALLLRHDSPEAAAAAIRERGIRHALGPIPIELWNAWQLEYRDCPALQVYALQELEGFHEPARA